MSLSQIVSEMLFEILAHEACPESLSEMASEIENYKAKYAGTFSRIISRQPIAKALLEAIAEAKAFHEEIYAEDGERLCPEASGISARKARQEAEENFAKQFPQHKEEISQPKDENGEIAYEAFAFRYWPQESLGTPIWTNCIGNASCFEPC